MESSLMLRSAEGGKGEAEEAPTALSTVGKSKCVSNDLNLNEMDIPMKRRRCQTSSTICYAVY